MQKYKKVAIIGSHQVGKTTLVLDIHRSVKDSGIKIIDEQSRYWIDKFSFDWHTIDPGHYLYFQKALYNYFNFALRLPFDFISDRTHLDVLAYTERVCDIRAYSELYADFVGNDKEFVKNDIKLYFYSGNVDRDGEQIENYLRDLMDKYFTDVRYFRRSDYEDIKNEIVEYLEN